VYKDVHLLDINKKQKSGLEFSASFISSVTKIMKLNEKHKLEIEIQKSPEDVLLRYFFQMCCYLIQYDKIWGVSIVDVLEFNIPIHEKLNKLLAQEKMEVCPYDTVYWFILANGKDLKNIFKIPVIEIYMCELTKMSPLQKVLIKKKLIK